jgi:Ca2+-binding EF-hand superfamily protein
MSSQSLALYFALTGAAHIAQIVFFWTLLARQISQFFDQHPERDKPKIPPPSQNETESPMLSQEQLDQIKEIFDLFDTDGGGTMDRQELAVAMCALGLQGGTDTKSPNENILSTIDSDGSNSISLEEFKSLMIGELTMSDPLQEIKTVFAGICSMDSSDPGQINLHKLRLAAHKYDVKLSDHELNMMLDEVDHDGSKSVDEVEFIRIMNLSTWF